MQIIALLLSLLASTSAFGSDWPMYARDEHRSRITDEQLQFPLRRAWVYECAQAPSPAWPPPVKNLNRLDFDYAPHPVIAEGLVCFGSSSDDTVRALDAKTGELKWQYTTDGPVRFAPQLYGGKVFVGSDDGYVYCLDATTGTLLWSFRGGPLDERLLGNGRMISRWPIRTGVLVADDVVYFAAGMWPAEGVYVYALDAEKGETLWCNDTSNWVPVRIVGHVTEPSLSGITPQGALLATADKLIIPMGRSAPATFDRETGKLLRHAPGSTNGTGGSWITIDGGHCYLYSKSFYSNLGILALSLETLARVDRTLKPEQMPSPRIPQNSVFRRGRQYSTYAGKVSVLVKDGKLTARKAYGLARAGTTLLVGGDGWVAAEDSVLSSSAEKVKGQGEVWRASVQGKAREIAVADGRLCVSTDQGELSCFVPGDGAGSGQALVHGSAGRTNTTAPLEPRVAEAALIDRISDAGMDLGYALTLADGNGDLARLLAERTRLKVIVALPEEDAVQSLREKLLTTTALYGTRIHVLHIARLDKLPFPQYFANVVLVRGAPTGLSSRELYRVLRPAGGLMLLPGMSVAEAEQFLAEANLPAEAIARGKDSVSVVRGRLPGAWDWDSGAVGDRHVKWPLRPIWFGGNGPARTHNRKYRGQTLIAANGRFFENGESHIVAMDAYNGTELWARPKPLQLRTGNYSSTLAADAKSAYLSMSASCFRKKGPGCIVLDAGTGRQTKIFAPYTHPAQVSLTKPRKWLVRTELQVSRQAAGEGTLDTGDGEADEEDLLDVTDPAPAEEDGDEADSAGSVLLRKGESGLHLTLFARRPYPKKLVEWQLHLDFRPYDERFGLYERGVYQFIILPHGSGDDGATWRAGVGEGHPTIAVAETEDAKGSSTTVGLPWSEIIARLKAQPSSFGFGVSLLFRDPDPAVPPVRADLFCDGFAGGLNNGWANVFLDQTDLDEQRPRPGIIAGPLEKNEASGLEELESEPPPPKEKRVPRYPRLDASLAASSRLHPLTGQKVEKFWPRGDGCSGITYSATSILNRSGNLGIYDLADESGIRTFGGVRPSCGRSSLAACGVWFVANGGAGCECTYSFLSEVALAPAERRLNEDWAVFCDWPADTVVKQAALNLGAPGDRRDRAGALWLGFPRPGSHHSATLSPYGAWTQINGVWQQNVPSAMPVPLRVEAAEGFGPYRVSAERVSIAGTDRPWLYTSGLRGLSSATMQLNFIKPLAARLADVPVKVDGALDDTVWQGEPHVTLPATKSPVFLAFDSENLYVAAKRPNGVDRRGDPRKWAASTTVTNATIYYQDHWEVFLSDVRNEKVIHLLVSAGGPRLHGITEGNGREDVKSILPWVGASKADENGFVAEFAVPWETLADKGLDRESIAVNVQVGDHPKIAEAFVRLGARGRARCQNFVPLGLGKPPRRKPRLYTVRLHFAELDEIAASRRVFNVSIQGKTVLEGFDILQTAGGARKAVVREFQHIEAGESITFGFSSASGTMTAATAPQVSAIELFEETPGSGTDGE